MRTYKFGTDSELGTVEAATIEEAIDKVRPTAEQAADGGWAWVRDDDGIERLDTREGD